MAHHLSIIIPALNEIENLEKLIPFLFNNKAESHSIEVIVVIAAGNSDNSNVLSTKYDCRIITSIYNNRASQMNAGFEISSGSIILFLHADVTPPASYYYDIMNSIDVGYSFGMFCYEFDQNNILLKINAFFTKYKGFFIGGGDQCHFMSRKTFLALGKFDELALMEDFEFFTKVKIKKIPFCIIQHPAKVSARKYKHNSYLKVNYINLITFIGYKCGVSSSVLKAFYTKRLKD